MATTFIGGQCKLDIISVLRKIFLNAYCNASSYNGLLSAAKMSHLVMRG
jgi:hypothetical protein